MKFVKWFFIVLIIFCVVGAVYFIFSINKFRSGDARDLGVSYSFRDYTNAVTVKAKVAVSDPANLYLGSNFETEGTLQIDEEFSNAEISAIQNYSNDKSGPFKNVQIAFHENGTVEASGIITDERINGPVYVSGKINHIGPRSFNVDTTEIVAGKYSVPSPLRKIIDEKFSSYVNGLLSNINGLSVEKIEIKEGAVRFIGDVPAKIY